MTDPTPKPETETPKITAITKTEKVKDPRRATAGKRLAQISKEAKERKARERLAAEADKGGWFDRGGYLIGAAGLVIAGASLYYGMRRDEREVRRLETIEEEGAKPEPQNVTIERAAGPVLDSFDE